MPYFYLLLLTILYAPTEWKETIGALLGIAHAVHLIALVYTMKFVSEMNSETALWEPPFLIED